MGMLWQDVRYGMRMLARSPGLAVTAVLCLGLGIGAATTIFSVVNGALLRPFPYEKPEELALVWEQNPQEPLSMSSGRVSHANLLDCKAASRTFHDLTVIGAMPYPLRYGDLFEPARTLSVTSNLFTLLGVRPMLGRPFLPAEDHKGNQQVVILMHECWSRWFGADPHVLGKTVTLRLFRGGEQSCTIVGVMPPEFLPPVHPTYKPDLLIPFEPVEPGAYRNDRRYAVIGRLRDDATFRQAQAELNVISRQLAEKYPKENRGWQWVAKPLRLTYCGNASQVLYLLLGASGLVLVVACGNVANLLLIRGLQREREIAVRTTLGAGRLRVLRQLAVEGLLLAGLGLLAGVFVSFWSLTLLRPLILSHVPVVGGVKVDVTSLVFASAVALATGAAFSLTPAFQAWRIDPSVACRGAPTHTTMGRQTRRVHSFLASSQMALAFILVVGAGLAIRTFANLLRIDPGFNPHNVLAMDIDLQRGNNDNNRADAFQEEFLTRVCRLPGVTAAATSDGLPLTHPGSQFIFNVEGEPVVSRDGYRAFNTWVSEDYFRTLGVPLLMGRYFNEADRRNRHGPVMIVNRALAQRFWPSGNAVGQRLKRRGGNDSYEIIGVVENEFYWETQLHGKMDVPPWTYFNRYNSGYAHVTVRTAGDPLSLAPAVKTLIRELDGQILVSRIRSMEDDVREAFSLQRMTMLLVGVFAVFAFTLSVVGLYGVMAHSARSRFREIAIRIATGARPADIVGMILKQGTMVVVAGMGAGLAGVFALARAAASYVYGVAPMDGLTLAGAGLLLGVASVVACGLPARRAAKIDPMAALRYE